MNSTPKIKASKKAVLDLSELHPEGKFEATILEFGEIRQMRSMSGGFHFAIKLKTPHGEVYNHLGGHLPLVTAMHVNRKLFIGMTVDVRVRHKVLEYATYASTDIFWRNDEPQPQE